MSMNMRGGHGLPILLPVLILALLMCLVVTAAPPDVNNRLLNLGRDELEAASGLTALAELWRGSHDVTGTTSIPSQVVTGGSDVIFSPSVAPAPPTITPAKRNAHDEFPSKRLREILPDGVPPPRFGGASSSAANPEAIGPAIEQNHPSLKKWRSFLSKSFTTISPVPEPATMVSALYYAFKKGNTRSSIAQIPNRDTHPRIILYQNFLLQQINFLALSMNLPAAGNDKLNKVWQSTLSEMEKFWSASNEWYLLWERSMAKDVRCRLNIDLLYKGALMYHLRIQLQPLKLEGNSPLMDSELIKTLVGLRDDLYNQLRQFHRVPFGGPTEWDVLRSRMLQHADSMATGFSRAHMLLAYPPRAGAIGEVESMVRAFRANADRFKRILDTEGIADSTPDGWGRRRSQDLRKNAVYQLACAGLERKFSGTDDVSIADDFLTMGSNLEQLLIEPVSDAASLFFQRLKSALQSDPSLSWDSMAPTLSQLDENSQKFVEVFKRTVKDLGIPEESLPMLTTDGFLANPDVFDLYSRLWSNASTFHSASSADGRAAQQHQADTGPSTAGTGPSTATAGAGLSALLRQEGGSGPSNAGAGSPAVGPLARHVMDITRHAP